MTSPTGTALTTMASHACGTLKVGKLVQTTLLDAEKAWNNQDLPAGRFYDEMPETSLTELMMMRKLSTTFTPSKIEQVQALVDYISKPVVYRTWYTESLERAIDQRGLPTYNTRSGRSRNRLISMLESADATPMTPFPFKKLPVELRLEVYKYAVTSSTALVAPQTPAITRLDSKTRAESLPIFWATNKFLMHGYLGAPYIGSNLRYTGCDFTVDERTTTIWDHYPQDYKKHVRNLDLSIHWGFMDDDLHPLAQFSVEHTLTLNVKITDIERKLKAWSVTVGNANDYAEGDMGALTVRLSTPARGWWRARAFCGVATKTVEEAYSKAVADETKKAQAYHFYMMFDMARHNLKKYSAPFKDKHSANKDLVKGFKDSVVDYFDSVLSEAQDVMETRKTVPGFGTGLGDWDDDDSEDESEDEYEDE